MPDYIALARLDVRLMKEWLDPDAPRQNDCIQIATIPAGPAGLPRLRDYQRRHGGRNVTTGVGPSDDVVGVWVRGTPEIRNFLRAYLSRP